MASHSEKKTGWTVKLRAEQWAPLFFGAIVMLWLMICAVPIAEKFATNQWSVTGLYSAIFDWAAIQTGFSFGVYGFVLGKGSGFVNEMRGTVAMARFISYIKRANFAGFALTILSIPLIISELSIGHPYSFNFIVVALWFSLFFWAFFSFLRIAYGFGKMASITDKSTHPA